MNINLGISSLIYNLNDAIDICSKFKEINHIEIGIDNLHECNELHKYKKKLIDSGISIGIHLPMELNTCENIEYIRESWIDFICKIDEELSEFDIKYYNMHLGYVITNRLIKNRNKYLDNSIKFLRSEKLPQNKNISIENVYTKFGDYSNIGNKVKDFEYIFSKVENNITFCYDTGHNLIDEDTYIKDLQEKISIIHLSDNDGIEDTHIGIGRGILSDEEINKVINIQCDYIILEIGYVYIEETIKKLSYYKKG